MTAIQVRTLGRRVQSRYSDLAFLAKYVALWAYGYVNGFGQAEGLYRTVHELGAGCFRRNGHHRFLDVGCGVGRTAADYAASFPKASVVGIDKAKSMLEMARTINTQQGESIFDLSALGFRPLRVPHRALTNLTFEEATLQQYHARAEHASFHLITAVNVIDRIGNVEGAFAMMRDLLVPRGVCVLASPLNFWSERDWLLYRDIDAVAAVAEKSGFDVEVKFDGLVYREMLDARGALEDYSTFIMRLRARP